MLQSAETFVHQWGTPLSWALGACWALAAIAAIARGQANPASRRWWFALAGLTAVLALEMPLGLRFQISDLMRSALKASGPDAYLGRRPVQGAVIVVGLVLACGALAWSWSAAARVPNGCKLAIAGACLGWSGVVLEIISLHQLDAHYLIYWSIWWAGNVLTFAGLAWKSEVVPVASGSRADSIAGRLLRLAIAGVLLGLPELVDLVWTGLKR